MKRIKTYLKTFFEFLGIVASIITIFLFFMPQEALETLKRVEHILEQRLPETKAPQIAFIELFQDVSDGRISNTMLRYFNPSPASAMKDFSVTLYQGGREVFSEQQPYLHPKTARDIFDIKITTRLSGPVTLCTHAQKTGEIIRIPLTPEQNGSMTIYRQDGETKYSTGTSCEP